MVFDRFTAHTSDIIIRMSNLKRVCIILLLALNACSGGTPSLPSVFASPTAVPPSATPLPPTETPVPMAIKVNADGITFDEFNAELARYKSVYINMGKTISEPDALKTVQEDLVTQLLLSQGAAETGFTMDENALQQRLDALITKIGGADKLAEWQKSHNYSPESFKISLKLATAAAWMRDKISMSTSNTAEQVHVRQILLYNEDVAKNYYSQLQAGADFDKLAAQVDPITNGDIGWFPRGYISAKTVEDAAFALDVNAYSTIISSEVGFHIIKLLERQPERELSPDALSVIQTQAINNWLITRRQQSTIVLAP